MKPVAVQKGPGAPSKKSAERMAKIIDAVRKGGSKLSAASAGGISPGTLRTWLKEDEDFAEQFEIAQGEFEQEQLQNIRTAGKEVKHWTASAWLLERIFPERYALQDPKGTRAVTDDGQIPPQIAVLVQQYLMDGGPPKSLPDLDTVEGEVREVPASDKEEPAPSDALKRLRELAQTGGG